MREYFIGIPMMFVGLLLTTFGGYITKAGWDRKKKEKDPKELSARSGSPDGIAVTSSDQSGGFTGVNNGVINFESTRGSDHSESRPQLSILRGHFQQAPHPEGSFDLVFDWTNVGDRGMSNPRSVVVLDSMDGSPFAQKIFTFDGIVHPNEPRHSRIKGLVLDSPNMAPLFVLRYAKYEDAVTGRAYDDTICMRWPGLTNGRGLNVMEMPTPEEAKALRDKHSGIVTAFK
jgi:hypothetical protein